MRALIVYESMFGATRHIGYAIASGLRPAMPVDVVAIEDAPGALGMMGADVTLLIVGAPSQGFGLSTPKSRATASRRAERPLANADLGLREWLGALPRATDRRDVLAYETRLRVRGLPGSAAKSAARQMRKLGYRLLWPPKSFYVVNLTGTLAGGELERARMWGRWLGVGSRLDEPPVDPAG